MRATRCSCSSRAAFGSVLGNKRDPRQLEIPALFNSGPLCGVEVLLLLSTDGECRGDSGGDLSHITLRLLLIILQIMDRTSNVA